MQSTIATTAARCRCTESTITVISIGNFHVPFGGTLYPDNRWVLFSSLMPWEELEEAYAPQFSLTTGAPAKPVRLAFEALFINSGLA